MDIKDRIAVVTGASEGIGFATAMALGQRGARVAICARTTSRVAAAAADLTKAGIEAAGTACDVTDPDAVARFAEFVSDRFGTPAILVNNAGIGRFAPVDEMALEEWDAVMNTNVRSLFLVTRAFLAAMKRQGGGTIVNVASLAGRNGIPGGAAYSASKHAALGFSRSLLLETRPHGVRVIAICPGSVDTAFFDKQTSLQPDRARILRAADVAMAIVHAIALPDTATVSEIELRPANP